LDRYPINSGKPEKDKTGKITGKIKKKNTYFLPLFSLF
jgi:hypothetical protein